MRHELIEDPYTVRLDDELVVIGAEVLRYPTGMLELVEGRFIETD
jgi:hypothetical protein